MTAQEFGVRVGSIVRRVGDDERYYEYEVSGIEPDGETMHIESDDAYPEYAYIMVDDCEVIKY